MRVLVGCCGFPFSKKKYYGEFSVVEVQSTFYKLPKVETAARWREEAPENFEFIVKAWQAITHPWGSPTWRRYGGEPPGRLENYGLLKYTEENCRAWEETVKICRALGCEKVLIQLPPSLRLTSDNMGEVFDFIRYMSGSGLRLIIEPRHESWECGEARRLFEELGIVHCVDPFKDRPWGTGDFYYFRLHGIDGYNYSYKYTDEDLRRLIEIVSGLEKKVYVLFNNKYMYEDSKRFMGMLGSA
jgi:uncharacterized protein YecE (DUF72 family)